jgi:peptidyl-prolyl cis-trans isomerase C
MLRKHVAGLAGVAVVASAGAATVVMQVNGVGVTDFALGRAKRAAAAMQQGQPIDEQTTLKRAVDQVIGHMLLVEAAREAGIAIDAAQVQRKVAAMRGRYSNPEAFAQALAESGTSETEVTRFEEENLLVQRYTETVLGPRAPVSKDEVSAYYREHPDEFDHPEQVKVRMILASAPTGATGDVEKAAKTRIAQAAKRLAAGEEFGKVAQDLSEDSSRSQGGEVGWVRRGLLLPELDEEVFKLQAGQYTKPIKTTYGYHIMGVAQRRPAGRSPLDEVEVHLTDMLKSNKVRDLLAREVTARRARAKIDTLDPAIKVALKP